jgi:hypothetical protein
MGGAPESGSRRMGEKHHPFQKKTDIPGNISGWTDSTPEFTLHSPQINSEGTL